MNILVEIRNSTIYPVCDRAKVFARMLGQRSLTQQNIKYIKELGVAIDVLQPEPVVL